MTKKKITSTEDQGEIEVPLKKQKVPENSTEEFVIQEKKKKRKKSETKTLDEFSVEAENEKEEEEDNNKKKAKKSADVTVEGENDDSNESDEDEKEKNEKKINKPKSKKFEITGKSLRNSFQKEFAFDEVRTFVTVCKENINYDLAADYLEEGGSVLEILKVFDTTDKKNINNIATLFSAVHILVIRVLGLYPEGSEQYTKTEETCRRLINTHTSSMQSMLSNQSNAKQRKTILKMLTTMITLGGTIPRDILTNLSLNSQILEAVTRLTKPTDRNNVRTSFIHFILAFLIDGRNNTIRSLLEKRDILPSIFPDLIYDSHDTVNLALTTVKKYVLENLTITKTMKLHIFTTQVVQSLVNLYNWKGPKNWPGLKKDKEKMKQEKIDPEEKEIAVEAVHEFLLILMTSKKYGIIFQDKSLGTGQGRKNNQLVSTVLKSLDRPWEHDKPGDLVVQILRACPDLMKAQITQTEPFLSPKATSKWIKLIQFLNQVINSLDIEKCFQDAKELTEVKIDHFANTVINLTLPMIVLRKAVAPALLHSNRRVRHESVLLFTTMLNQTKKLLSLAEDYFECTKFQIFNNHLIEYMTENAPIFERCLRVWKKALEPSVEEISEEQIDTPSIDETLVSILNLLKAYQEAFPALVYLNVKTDVNFTMLLTGLTNPLEIPENLQTDLNILAIDFLLSTNAFMFTPAQELYGESLLFLLMTLDEDSPLFDKVKSSIVKLLEVPRAFYECEDQIEIWLNTFLGLKEFNERLEVSSWFVKIVNRIFKNVEKYHLAIKTAEESCGIEIEKYMSFFQELKAKGAYCKKNNDRLQYVTSLPLVLCSALDSLKKKSTDIIIRFMNEILIHTIYYQVKPDPLIYLTKDIKELKLELI